MKWSIFLDLRLGHVFHGEVSGSKRRKSVKTAICCFPIQYKQTLIVNMCVDSRNFMEKFMYFQFSNLKSKITKLSRSLCRSLGAFTSSSYKKKMKGNNNYNEFMPHIGSRAEQRTSPPSSFFFPPFFFFPPIWINWQNFVKRLEIFTKLTLPKTS